MKRLAFACLTLASCASPFPETPDPPAGATLLDASFKDEVRRKAREFDQYSVEPERAQALLATPVVDVHVHSFNARYLPIQNILLGKRDVSKWGVLLSDEWAVKVAAAVTSATELAPMPSVNERLDPIRSTDRRSLGPGLSVTVGARDNDPEHVQALGDRLRDVYDESRARGLSTDETLALLEERVLDAFEENELRYLRLALETLHEFFGDLGYVHFLTCLLNRDDLQLGRFYDDFQPDDSHVDLIVNHMMDLGPVYGQRGDSVLLEPFALGQVPRMAHYQDDDATKMVYFVAYNPFRDNGGHGGRAMEIVEEAIEERGAWGVKVYPPSGYRPSRNAIPDRPRALLTEEPGKQWDARYHGVSNQLLDRRLDALFDYCSTNDIPIFTHCSPGEFEARKGYSVHHADPRWWRPVLEKYPKLRLCFGHAGGSEFWFGVGDEHEEWGRIVYEYCVEYENVYCEVGVHAELVEKTPRRYFMALLGKLLTEPRGTYPFEEKLLYGSDWFMPRDVDAQHDFLGRYQEVFLDETLERYYEGFFAENALRFLNVEERLANDPAVPASVRARLTALLP